jgi:hypothetical protein
VHLNILVIPEVLIGNLAFSVFASGMSPEAFSSDEAFGEVRSEGGSAAILYFHLDPSL